MSRAAPPATRIADLEVDLLAGIAPDVAAIAARLPVAAVAHSATVRGHEVRTLLARAQIDAHLAAFVAPTGTSVAAPGPAPILAALDRIEVTDRNRVLLVGEDARAADGAGVAFARLNPDGLLATVDAWLERNVTQRVGAVVGSVRPPDARGAAAAEALQNRLTKPRGALGGVEVLGIRLAAMAGVCPPPLPTPPAVAVFAGDHGVVAEGVTPWPQEVTAQMVANLCAGGAAINVLARQAGASVVVVDVGVASPPAPTPALLARNVRRATANLASGPAMTGAEARTALVVGVEVAQTVIATGARCLVPGDMGIGNTTPAAAVIAALTRSPAASVTGRGTGVDDATLERKTLIVERAVRRLASSDPVDVLAEVGGLEIAAIAGFVLAGAAARVPVVVDGVVSLAGALAADAIAPGAREWMVAGHRSVEPGASVALGALGLDPLLDLGLRLGEGSGAALALPLVEASARILREMATFDSAGVTDKG